MKPIMLVLVMCLVFCVLAILGAGLWQMVQDGPEKRKKSNKMMQLRVFMQGAILLILILMAAFS